MQARVGRGVSILWLAGLCGCTITQTAKPVSFRETDAKQMCVIEDPTVFPDFLAAYRWALGRKGFSAKMLAPGSSLAACPLTSTYYALQSWDFVTYLSHAVIVVYRDGTEAGEALYDAPKAGFALTDRIYEPTESKVATMVDQLFPELAGPECAGCSAGSAASASAPHSRNVALLHGTGILGVNGRHAVVLNTERPIAPGHTTILVGSVHSRNLEDAPQSCEIAFDAQSEHTYSVVYSGDTERGNSPPCRWRPAMQNFDYDIRNCALALLLDSEGTEIARCRLTPNSGDDKTIQGSKQ